MSCVHRFPALLAAAALLLAGLLAGCGSSGADDDPVEVLERTFNGEGDGISSADLDLSFAISASADPDAGINLELAGPFQNRDDDLPLIDLGVDLVGDQTFSGGLLLTDSGGFISASGRDYEIDSETLEAFKRIFAAPSGEADEEEGDGPSTSLLGLDSIDPTAWVVDPVNEGLEDVGGSESIHISGTPEVLSILQDFSVLAARAGGSASLDPGVIADRVTKSSIDVYSGADDDIVRGIELSIVARDKASGESIEITFSLTLSNVNGDQSFEEPEDARPITDLFPGGLNLNQLGFGGSGSESTPGVDPETLNTFQQCVAEAGKNASRISACFDQAR